MLAHTIKKVLELVPEALPMVKQASITENSPTNNRDSVLASALSISYCRDISKEVPDLYEMEKVAEAVKAYNLDKEVEDFSKTMVKRAHFKDQENIVKSKEHFLQKQASVVGSLAGASDIAEIAKNASMLVKQAKELGYEDVLEDIAIKYSGTGTLYKEAAVNCLKYRAELSGNEEFTKLATALENTKSITSEQNSALCIRVTEMDKTAGLNFRGLDFYRETQLAKEAALTSSLQVKINGTMVPYEKLEKLGKSNISNYIGKDIAAEMDRGPQNFKSVVETLPLDMQRHLSNLLKNV